MAETPDAERLLNEDEPAGPGSVVDRLRTRAEAFETRPAMHDGFTYTADDAKLDRDAIAALRVPASPPVQDAGELVGLAKARSETAVERLLRHLAILAERGSEIDRLDFRNENGEWVSASVAIEGAAAEIERLTADLAEALRACRTACMEINELTARATEADLAEARAALEEAKAEIKRLNTVATDRSYMMHAYRDMLGPVAIEMVKRWEAKGVTRFHASWGPEAAKLSGEERAAHLMDADDRAATGRKMSAADLDREHAEALSRLTPEPQP